MKEKKEVKRNPKYQREIIINFKGKTYPIQIDEAPFRHKDEDFEDYKERQKMNRTLLKMKKREVIHESISYIDKIIGRKGKTYIKSK